jgi:hypothetical protein
MRPTKRFQAIVLTVILFLAPAVGLSQTTWPTVALKKTFIEKYKNRATVTTTFNVDRYPKAPHAVSEDGDIHVAGRDSVAKLPLVVEIMNPRYLINTVVPGLDIMKDLKGISSGQAVKLTGAWRLWFEHPSKEAQVQGKPVPLPANTNPDHIFEIHPVTEFNGIDVLQSLVPIKGYKKNFEGELTSYEAYRGNVAFPYYESIIASISESNTAVMIASKKAKYNYAEFVIELAGKPKELEDCYMVMAYVYDTEETEERLTSDVRRMVFIKDSPPAIELAKYSKGDKLRVVGIPRINLNEVLALAAKVGSEGDNFPLPYEMIIAAVSPTPEE